MQEAAATETKETKEEPEVPVTIKEQEDDSKGDDDGILDMDDVTDDHGDDEVLNEERGDGDGQEEKEGKVDDDEDRRNPQYIPKKGMFYEHDDRIDSADEEEAAKLEAEKPRRVPRSEGSSSWGHDKFLEREQVPKTKEELVSAYGYDIRVEDSAPRARRRRRYGRGPNKYTRNWEDEEAYEPKTGPAGPKSPAAGREPELEEEQQPPLPPRDGGGRGRGRGSKSNEGPLKIEDAEQFPALESQELRNSRNKEDISSKRGAAPAPRGGRGGGRGRGQEPLSQRGGSKSRGAGGGGKISGPSEYSANQRLQNQKTPKVEKVVEAKLNRIEKDFNTKTKLDDKKRVKDSPHAGRKAPDEESTGRNSKRYSNTRQQPRGNQRPQQEYYNDYNDQHHERAPVPRFVNGSATPSSVANYVATSNNFPTSASGPPPNAPFLAAGATPTSTSGFLDPTAMVNYGPPPQVQYTPVAVPVTVTVPLVTAVVTAGHDSALTVLTTGPHGTPTVTSPEQVLLAAAAAGQGYAEVRGGVTYFNPTAQAPIMARPVGKRPKAAIPIVDPSQMAAMSPQSSTEEIEEHPSSSRGVENNKVSLMAAST